MLGYYNYTVWLTYLGFLSGVTGLFFASSGMLRPAVAALMLSGLCDMFDGLVARTRERTVEEQKFGIQLDSLSDLLCFCVLPAFIGFRLGLNLWWQELLLALFALGGLIRLAYFNVAEDVRQQSEGGVRKYYEGLPVTNTALIVPLTFCFQKAAGAYFRWLYLAVMVACGCAFVCGRLHIRKPKTKKELLMVATVGLVLMLALVLLR